VPVIAIPLALRPTASRAVEATNGPAVQSLTWTHHHRPSLIFSRVQRNDSASSAHQPRLNFVILEFREMKSGARISAGMGENRCRYRYLNIEAGGRDHLCGAHREGVNVICLLFVVCCLLFLVV
jgi:hypothetical protein